MTARRPFEAASAAGLDAARPRSARSGRSAPPSSTSCVTSTSVVPRSATAVEEEVGDLVAGVAVEIAGRLVGDQDRRLDRRARGRSPRAAARRRKAAPDSATAARRGRPGRALLARALEGVGAPGQLERHRDVLERRHGLHQVEGLEDEADLAAAEAREPVLVEAGIVLAGDDDAARVDPLQPRDHHEQRRFSRARRPDQADALAALDREVDAAQHMHARRAASERQIDIVEKDDGFSSRGGPPI